MCDSKKLKNILDLGHHSLVNSYLKKNELKNKELLLPLKISQCLSCGLVQLLKTVDPNKIYNDGKYLYFSRDVPGLSDYYKKYANYILKNFVKKRDLVIEIASNDGILLQHLEKKINILGIDAAPNAVLRALKNNIPTFPSLFNFNTSNLVLNEFGKAKLIMANQCIAHVDNLKDFMKGINNLLDDRNGIFIFETGYWGSMVRRTIYEQIYHDHFSYFSLEVWEKFSKNYNLEIFDAIITPAQDNCSIRVFFSRKKKKRKTKRLKNLLKEEKKDNINSLEKSLEFKNKVKKSWINLKKILINLKNSKKTIVAYGASAKAGTISTCAKLDSKIIDFFIDDSPSKQGKYTPIFHIPILSRKEAFKKKIDYILILAVNYADIIIKKEKNFRDKGGRFIIPRGENVEIL